MNEYTFHSVEAKSIAELVVLWKNIRSDGKVDAQELRDLKDWLAESETVDSVHLSEIRCLFKQIIADKRVSSDELKLLNQAISRLGSVLEQGVVLEDTLASLDESEDIESEDFASSVRLSSKRKHANWNRNQARKKLLVGFCVLIASLLVGVLVSYVAYPPASPFLVFGIVIAFLLAGAWVNFLRVIDKPAWVKARVTRRKTISKRVPTDDGGCSTSQHTRFWFNVGGREYVGSASGDWRGSTVYHDPRFPARNSHEHGSIGDWLWVAIFLVLAGAVTLQLILGFVQS